MIFSETKAAVDLVKDLAALLRQTGNYDPVLIQKFDDLRGQVLTAYQTEIELYKEVDSLNEKVRQLEARLELQQMSYDKASGLYFVENGGKRDYYCQRCADADKKQVRVTEQSHGWTCRACNQFYQTEQQNRNSRMIETVDPDIRNRSTMW